MLNGLLDGTKVNWYFRVIRWDWIWNYYLFLPSFPPYVNLLREIVSLHVCARYGCCDDVGWLFVLMLKSAIEKELKSESNPQIWSSLINTVGNSFSDNWRSSEYTDYIRSNSKAQHFWFTERKPTVMFIRTFILVWSKRTVTECIPSSTTTTVRGKRKKATSAEARRHNTTEMTTYSFLQHRNITSTLQAWTTCKCHFIWSTSEIKRDSSHRNRVFRSLRKSAEYI